MELLALQNVEQLLIRRSLKKKETNRSVEVHHHHQEPWAQRPLVSDASFTNFLCPTPSGSVSEAISRPT